MDILQAISLRGIVPVIKLNRADDAVPLCGALLRGGLPVAEITFRTDAAEESIRRVHGELPGVLLGAGTVLSLEQVDRAARAGAAFIVSPGLNPAVVRHCQEIGIPVLPGCACPSDIERALELGLKTVKFFPAETLGGVDAIKAMSAPYGQVTFIPTGGIDEKKLPAYLAFPKILACGGSWMVKEAWVDAGDFAAVEAATRAAVDAMLGFSLSLAAVSSLIRGEAVTLRTRSVKRAAAYLKELGLDPDAGRVTLVE